jgi:hypothetical protein
LVLSGPIKSETVAYKIWHLPRPLDASSLVELVTVKTDKMGRDEDDKSETAKAESLTVIEEAPDKVVVIINYDNVDEGYPTRHEFALKKAQ